MKERILIVIKDEGLLEEAASALYKHDYLITKASDFSQMESNLNATPQDVIILDSELWIKERPDLVSKLGKNFSDTSIINLMSKDDQDAIEPFTVNGMNGLLYKPVTSKEIIVLIDEMIKYRELMNRYQQMRNELLEVNKNLSHKNKEFQESFSLNQNILQSVNIGILTIDRDFKITSWNPEMAEISGLRNPDVMGEDLFQVLPALYSNNLYERVRGVITEGKPTEVGHLKEKNGTGEEIATEYKFAPIKKGEEIAGAVVTVHDITQKTLMKEEIDRSQRYAASLIDNSADVIIGFDLEGIIVAWNKGAEETFGYKAQDTIGRAWDFLFSEQDRRRMYNLIQWVKGTGAISNFDTHMMSKEGKDIPFSLTISLIKDDEEKVFGLSCIAKDLSETKQIRKQIIQSQKMIYLGEIAAGMAQDINNPLASLSKNTEILMNRQEKMDYSDLNNHLKKVEEGAARIEQLVKDLIWYSNPPDQETGMIDIHEILDKAIIFASYQKEFHNIEIKREYIAQPSLIMVNGKEMVQAFINIFINSIAAMPDGGMIHILTSTEGDAVSDTDAISIKIKDNGIGIPEANRSRVFEQFFTTKSDGKGNGMGLYVVKEIVKDHKGKIDLESDPNKGTCFTIRLPIKTEEEG